MSPSIKMHIVTGEWAESTGGHAHAHAPSEAHTHTHLYTLTQASPPHTDSQPHSLTPFTHVHRPTHTCTLVYITLTPHTHTHALMHTRARAHTNLPSLLSYPFFSLSFSPSLLPFLLRCGLLTTFLPTPTYRRPATCDPGQVTHSPVPGVLTYKTRRWLLPLPGIQVHVACWG